MRLFLIGLVAALFATAPALADDSALNKEGFWTVGRGDAEAKGCMASVNVGDDAMLLIQVAPGHVDFVVGTKKPMRKGKAGVLTVGDSRFDFAPAYSDKRDFMFLEDVGGRALAAARDARNIGVMIDGRELLHVNVENTGLPGALDAAVACSKGESGWWGPGVGATPAKTDVAAAPADDPFVYQADGDAWGIATFDGYCIAQAMGSDARSLQLLAIGGHTGLAIGSKDAPLPRGRKALVETDSYRFEFKTEYSDDARYVSSADPLESPDLFALQRAKQFRVTTGGRELLDVAFDGDTFFRIVGDVDACGRGEKGWWGGGAKAR